MRKVSRDIADMNSLESCNKLVTYHYWFASPLLDLQADSLTHMRNGTAPLMPPLFVPRPLVSSHPISGIFILWKLSIV